MKYVAMTACIVLAQSVLPLLTAAHAEEDGVRVMATGVVMAKPTRLEINLETTGQAELSSDAAVKYRTAVQQTTEAFEQLGIEGLEVQSGALGMSTIGQAGANQAGQNNALGKEPINITRSFRLVLPNIDKLTEEQLTDTVSKLVDTAKDVGTSIGGSSAGNMLAQMMGRQVTNSVVTFVVEDTEQLREKAYQEAFALARKRAEKLADLAGAELGDVLAIEEAPMTTNKEEQSAQVQLMMAVYGVQQSGDGDPSRVASDKLDEIPIRVALQVRFGLKRPGGTQSSGVK